jgi:uncharacterized integral membrane protein
MPVQNASSHESQPGRDLHAEKRTRGSGTRTSAAWLGICVGVLLLVALVVFMLQNTGPVAVSFLGLSGTAPLALALLISGLAVGLVVLMVGALRIGQLRRRMSSGSTDVRR